MRKQFEIEHFSFQKLARNEEGLGETVIAAIEKIASEHRKKAPTLDQDNFNDVFEYRDLIFCNFDTYPNFGRVFLATKEGEKGPIGFILCFDDQFRQNKNTKTGSNGFIRFPLGHCYNYFKHDIPFLRDLDSLENFAYCFQIGVQKYRQGSGCANELLNHFERYYSDKKVLFLAASIHERQKSIIEILLQRNKIRRHQDLYPNKDFSTLFIDHYFDPDELEGHWFRVVQILDNREFVRLVNYENLQKAFGTIIPIQLNQALDHTNKIIENLDAKVVWSSFFNASNLLKERYSIGKDHHSFFKSILEVGGENYNKSTALLSKITKYLQDKDSKYSNVASLTESFKRKSYELFFFNQELHHQMNSFNNPLTLSLSYFEDSLKKLLRFSSLQKIIPHHKLTSNEKQSWRNDLESAIKKPSEKTQNNWNNWKEKLLLRTEEVEILETGIRYDLNLIKSISPTNREDYINLIQIINKGFILKESVIDMWRDYLKLHKVLFEIDAMAMDNPSKYWWCHAIVPINYSSSKNIIGIMFTFKCKKLPKYHKDYSTRMNDLAYLLTTALSKNILNILIKLQDNYAIESSNRYALGALASRNLAHNVGSHILSNLDTKEAILALRKQFPDSIYKDLARFHSYLRTRTNLLADLVTSEPVSAVNKWLNREVIEEFNQLRIVKRFISGNHINKIKVYYKDLDGSDQQDILIQIPNGDLGIGAFFILIENIIRNSAKYEDTNNLKTLELSVEVESDEDRGYYVLLYDHIPRKLDELKELVIAINQKLKNRSYRVGTKIRGAGRGLTEMQAAAAYLRKKVPGIIIDREETPTSIDFIKALPHRLPTPVAKPSKESESTLAYQIYLKKPRNAIIVNTNFHVDGFETVNLIKHGIKVISEEDLIHDNKRIHSHNFVVHFDQTVREKIQNNKRFPLRWVQLKIQEEIQLIRKFLNQKDGELFLNHLWQIWLRAYCGRKNLNYQNLKLMVLDEKSKPNLDNHFGPLNDLYIYDSHGKFLPKHLRKQVDQLGFYQTFSSVDYLGRILKNTKFMTDKQKENLKFQLLEAAITRILIVDERIQKGVERISTISKKDLFGDLVRMRIHIPNPNLKEPDLNDQANAIKVEDWITDLIARYKVDFIVIHLGMLESWVGSKMSDVSGWIKEKIKEIDDRPEVVLISGRGKPYEFPAFVCYQPASTIAEFVVGDAPSKYHLTQVLFSSRTRIGI